MGTQDTTTGVDIVELGGGVPMRINSATTTLVKSGPGTLVSIINNHPLGSSVITAYDNTAASGKILAQLTNPLAILDQQMPIEYDAGFANGLTIVTSAADDITVITR